MAGKKSSNSMNKAAKMGIRLGITILAIVFICAFVYFACIDDAVNKSSISYVFASASDYSGAVASLNSSALVAISDIATSSYILESENSEINRFNKGVTSRSNSTRTDQVNYSNVPSVVESIEQEIQEELAEKGNINLDEKVEKVIDILKNKGKTDVLCTYLGDDEKKEPDEKTQKDYLKAFLKASYSTKFPKLSSENSELDGIVRFKRGEVFLEYKPYNEFTELINSNSDEVLNYFSLKYENQSMNLILATWATDSEGNKTYSLLNPINYQKELNLFAMPFDFIWAMLVVSEGKEFTYELANLAIDEQSSIIITIYDTEIEIQEEILGHDTEEAEADVSEEIIENDIEVSEEATVEDTEESNTDDIETESEEEVLEETEKTTPPKENVVNIAVTQADTWLLNYYMEALAEVETDEETGIQKVVFNKQPAQVDEKLEPDSEEANFVTLINKYKSSKKNVVSAAEWLYEILGESEDTVDMIDTVKYILYKATNEDERFAGVEIDWPEMANIGDFGLSGGLSLGGTGYWWPIGSLETETINGKLFASGTPALGMESVTRAGLSTSAYNGSPYGTHQKGNGAAIDVGAGGKSGYYNVVSIGSGTVTKVQNGDMPDGQKSPDVGNCVTVNYNGLIVRYMHLYKGSIKVSVGDKVDYGQVIGKIGNSGDSDGAHLHIDMQLNGNFVDATEYINPNKPRSSLLYNFILKFEGGQNYRDGENYVVFNNGVDNCLEVTCGMVITFDKESGIVRDEFEPVLGAGTRYKAGDTITKAQYESCFDIMRGNLDVIINNSCGKNITLTQAQHDAIFTIGWRLACSDRWIG